MSKRLDENLGSVGYDGLIVANEPVADVFTVTIRKEATAAATYKRGTVLALSAGTAGDGKLVILGSTATTNETLTANCILAEDVEVGTTADVTVLAYRTGHFARNKLAVAWHQQGSGKPDPGAAQGRHPALRRHRILREGGQQNAF